MQSIFASLAIVLVASTAAFAAPTTTPRPPERPEALNAKGAPAVPIPSPEANLSTSNAGFQRWVQGFRNRALARGIRPEVFDAAFRGARYNADVIQKDRNQSEYTKQLWDYLDRAVSDNRVNDGRRAFRSQQRTLTAIEARYGVDAQVVVAIWGMESAYGEVRGSFPVIESLATLAYDGRRGSFFEEQLIAALKILQSGDVAPANMTGSWAGAMGHTQFIPTSYLAYAQDFTGDGRRDIWSDDPSDALASTAAYLARAGWRKGQPWGVEVQLPPSFDYSQAARSIRRAPSDWARIGVRDMKGRVVPDYGRASIMVPAGARGAAFMIFDNFAAIERYNKADAYVIAVGHLSDRITGGDPIRADWPRQDPPLAGADRQELQLRLTQAGFSTKGVDGVIGPNTIDAIRAFQRANGLPPDGYPSYDILRRLR